VNVALAGNAPAATKVNVNIKHPWRGQLTLHLQAPDGSLYLLKAANAADSGDDVTTVYTVNASTEPASGTWRLRVNDNLAGNIGTLYGWTDRAYGVAPTRSAPRRPRPAKTLAGAASCRWRGGPVKPL